MMPVSFIYSLFCWLPTLFVITVQLTNIEFVVTRNPDNQTIGVGGTAVMNCGYDSEITRLLTGYVIEPLAYINETLYGPFHPSIAGLPLQFIAPVNDTNASRIIIGPVGKQFVGRTNFSCKFSVFSPLVPTVVLTVLDVPAIVPDVKVDNSTIKINENKVTLTLNWGEPFNNLDPIVNYTMSCSGDVRCPPNFTTTDNTTRSYTITNLTPTTHYTFSVVATNSIGSGEAGVVMIPGVKFHNIKVLGGFIGSRIANQNKRPFPHRRGRDYN